MELLVPVGALLACILEKANGQGYVVSIYLFLTKTDSRHYSHDLPDSVIGSGVEVVSSVPC